MEMGQKNQGKWGTSSILYQWEATEGTRQTKSSTKFSVLPYTQAKYLGKVGQAMDEQGWLKITK